MADLDALVASPWWRWMPGMLATGPGWFGEARLVEVDSDGDPCLWTYRGYVRGPAAANRAADTSPWDSPEARPDPTDPATLGCLLALAREAWGDPELFVRREIGGPNWVTIRPGHAQPFRCDTEAAALIAAILAAPTPGSPSAG